MGISRNMYLDIRDIDEIMNIYTTAWDKGLKTTYYLHMKPRHSAEQSTTVVNKATSLGKRGFAVLRDKAVTEQEPKEEEKATEIKQELHIHLSEDPQEKFLCDSCQ